MTDTPLYHYTCDHGAAGIGHTGIIEARLQPPDGRVPLVWLTDLEAPNRAALGLTSRTLRCDRLAFRFEVPRVPSIARYIDVRKGLFPAWWWKEIEAAPGALPMHWYVSTIDVVPVREERKKIHG